MNKTSKQLLLTKKISQLTDAEIMQILVEHPIPLTYQYRKQKYSRSQQRRLAVQVAAAMQGPEHDGTRPDLTLAQSELPSAVKFQLASVLQGTAPRELIDRQFGRDYPTLEDHLSGRSPPARPYINTTVEWLYTLKEKFMSDVVALNAHVTGLGDRIRTIVDLAQFLKGLDMVKVSDLFKQLQAIVSATTLKDKISAAVSFMATFASMTASEIDDQVVAFLTKLVNSGAVDLLLPLVEKLLQAKAESTIASDEALIASIDADAASAAGFEIGTLIALAKLIAQLLDIFKN